VLYIVGLVSKQKSQTQEVRKTIQKSAVNRNAWMQWHDEKHLPDQRSSELLSRVSS